jgi:hypothetical protein
MSASKPDTKNWSAKESTDLVGKDRKLTVTGDVEVSNSNATPRLAVAATIPINERILMLELTLEASGTGNPAMSWKTARYAQAITEDQYESVEILFGGDLLGSAKVEKVHSLEGSGGR